MARTKQTAKKTTGAIGQHADIPPPTTTPKAGGGRTDSPVPTRANTNVDDDLFLRLSSANLGEDNPGFYNGKLEPIAGAIINVSCTTLAFFPKLNTQETLLLLIAVRGAERMDEPAVTTYQLLNQFFGRGQGNLHYATIFYDLANSAGSEKYELDVTKLIAFIKRRGATLSHSIQRAEFTWLRCSCRVVVFFVTHTTPDGDLHFSGPRPANRSKGAPMLPGNSNTPAAVLNRIFTEQFLGALQRIKETSLFLLICGGYCGHEETMQWVNSVVRRQSFREVISFTNKHFQPFWASAFCARFVQSFYLEDVAYPIAMEEILSGDARLGIASDVVVITRDKESLLGVQRDLYIWAQEKRSPYGFRLPTACPTSENFHRDSHCSFIHTASMPKVKSHHAYFDEQAMTRRLRQFAGGKDMWACFHLLPVGRFSQGYFSELPLSWRGVAVGQIGNVLRRAYQNIGGLLPGSIGAWLMFSLVTLPVTADELTAASHKQRTVLLGDVRLGQVNKATVLVSKDKKPLIIYLPHAIAKHVERKATVATAGIDSILARGMKSKGNWRSQRERFKPYGKLPIGQEAFSGGWYAQGHANSKALPRPSVSLRSHKNSNATEQWLKETATLNKSINLIMGAVHPDSYRAGVKALDGMRTRARPGDIKWAELWQSVATAVAVVSNGTSPAHFDSKGDVKQFDALTNLGADQVELGFPDLGGSFHYHGGSVVLFSGRLFKHEVKDWVPTRHTFDITHCTIYTKNNVIIWEKHTKEQTINSKPINVVGQPPRASFNMYGKTSGEYVQEWIQHRASDIHEIAALECLPSNPKCALCKCALDALVLRCTQCFNTPLLCSSCCLNQHRQNPFHQIQSWDDGFFKDCSLNELGLVLYLGHAGERCPASNGEPDTSDPFTLGANPWFLCTPLLLQARLFPATSDRPSTAFTFEVLDELHLQRIECKTASSNFYNLLRRKTDFNSPLDIPDRSREIERASRCYRDLCSRLKTGCWGDEDNAPGQQAIFCPACPQPGINVTSKTWNAATDPDWLLSPLLVADGNFKFDHLQLKNPQSDVALRDGTGFLVTTSTYENHLDVTSGTQEKSNCANHKAVNQASRPRKHVDNTVVNFKKGEQQKNMDFALSEAMKFFTSLKKEPLQPAITVIYDVMCQYGVHLEQRLEDGPFLEKPTMPIQKAIGKFHLGAHIDSCFSKFSLNFLRGAGHTDGEVLETLWAPLNKIAGSTRSMTLAHRQEVLDDCAYDSNWKKITNLIPSLIKKWKRAETSFAEMKEAYEDLRCRLSEDDLESWNSQAEQASLLRGKALEIYDVKIEQNPSVAGVRLEMVEKELVNGAYLLGGAAFITKGLSLEEAQYKLRVFIKSVGNFPTIPQKNTIADKRRIMKRNIEQHRRQGEKLMGLDSGDNDSGHEMEDGDSDKGEEDGEDEDDYMPGVGSPTADCESIGQTPEQMSICFPSSFTVEERVQMGWTKLAEQEVRLREAQVNDALHDLRISLGEKSLRFRKVLRGDRSQKHVTRAWSGINAYDARANLQVDIYEGAVEALKRLGAGNEWKPINRDRDLQMKGDVEHPNRIGQSSHSLAWFWRLQSAEISEEVEDSPMMKEFYRINYLRAKARRDRWEEELILLKKEISWALEWFQYQSDKWSKMADTETSSGLIAHSRKMAFVWKEFRRRGREVVQDSGCVELAQAI
ncbi:hypothetical protein EYR38_002997 [Pleurotus pulmonarius]|nr:hypothetical protein EYR38_002997 [Pleurotus pulmonarius]